MFDFLRLGAEQHVHLPPGWRKTACRLVGHRGFGFAIKLWALRRQLKRLPRDFEVGSILDFGCGDGMYTFYLQSQYPQARIEGVDGHAESVQAATQVAASNPRYANVSFQTARFENFRPARQYDLVVCLDCIYYTEQGLDVLAKVCECVRPGGFLILSSPRLKRHYGRGFDYYIGQVDVDKLDPLFQPERTAAVLKDRQLEVLDTENYPNRLAHRIVEDQRARKPQVSLLYPFYMGMVWTGRRGTAETGTHYMHLGRRREAA